MSPRGKYRTLPLKEKLAAIQEVDAGVKKTEVALKYGITKSTLTTILKAKDKLQNNASRFAPDRKRLREAAYPDLENAVLLRLKRARSSNLPINGPILREKAEELSLRLGIEDFKCSDGWISRFKERHGLSFKTTEGDDESQVLSALKAHNIAADLDSYAATDDNLCVCREDTLDDLVAEVLPAQHSSESEEEPEVENVTTAQAFQYIAKSESAFAAAESSQEQFVVLSPEKRSRRSTLSHVALERQFPNFSSVGMDVIAQAQSGTGKTATFSIAILQQIDTSLKECQALILAPTRELAQQIQKVVIALGDYMSAQCHACIGGTNVREDIRKLEKGVHVVVGTPGRVFDMISRKALRTNNIRIFVLDEADEMLSRGFKDQIYDVFRTLNSNIQVASRILHN
ncbi:hypothetical protein HPB51_009801 [Rhipicephalus microplus]|uniref:Uncharacterized protein n=1 Tax=Rhipicephalus microplus TaxID=6941 RepID=A0A9J6F1Q7_RHIMP|nr:hypothetical protein HPB51_009801 [Rhipicephalus microplus]